jgi:hypothetical protein
MFDRCTTLLLTMTPVLLFAAEDYPINLSARAFVGERYAVSCTVTTVQRVVWKIDGQDLAPQEENRSISLTATAEVLVAGAVGSECKTRFVVERLEEVANGMRTELLVPGAVVVAERKGMGMAYEIDGRLTGGAVGHALASLINLDVPEVSLDDAVFGTKERKKIGETWSINPDALAADLSTRIHAPTEAKDVSGTVTLAEALPEGLKFTSQFQATNLKFTLGPKMTVSEGSLTLSAWSIFPTDPTRRPPRKVMTFTMTVAGSGEQDGRQMVMVMTVRNAQDYSFSALPSAP